MHLTRQRSDVSSLCLYPLDNFFWVNTMRPLWKKHEVSPETIRVISLLYWDVIDLAYNTLLLGRSNTVAAFFFGFSLFYIGFFVSFFGLHRFSSVSFIIFSKKIFFLFPFYIFSFFSNTYLFFHAHCKKIGIYNEYFEYAFNVFHIDV